MIGAIRFRVDLEPVGQPRARVGRQWSKTKKRFVAHGYTERDHPILGWKAAVTLALGQYRHAGWTGPVGVRLAFLLTPPKQTALVMRAAGLVLMWADGKPDADNLAKGVLDAVNDGRLWGDDSQVVILEAAKWYTLDPVAFPPGVRGRVKKLAQREAGPDEWLDGRVFP